MQPSREVELHMMKTPDEWPLGIILPLKKKKENQGHGFPDHGFLVCSIAKKDPEPVVFRVNYFMAKNFQDIEKDIFESFEEIYDAGWRVD